jgi:large conductance mechanosensitive channel
MLRAARPPGGPPQEGFEMGLVQEFRDFAMRGNVVDMAVGVVIGAAFGRIVASFTNDVLMPPVGLAVGGVDFSDWKFPLREARDGVEAVTMNVGVFLNTVIDFLIIAAAIFLLVKAINSLRKKEEAKPAEPSPEVVLLTEIRDTLRQR